MMTDESPLDMAAIARLEEWGGATLRGKMIELFLQHAPERLEGVRKGLAEGDDALTERSAHSLKSSAANLGAEKLRKLSGIMEAAMEKGDRETVFLTLPEAEEQLARVIEALKGLLDTEETQ